MSNVTVLVVGDEHNTTHHLQQCLQQQGYILTAGTGSADNALALADTHKPDIVLMDFFLKGTADSSDIGRQLVARGIPVIYLGDCENAEAVHRATASDASGFISLPCDCARLAATLEVALHRREMERHLRESEARFRHIFECSPIGMALVNVDGNILSVNAAFAGMTGFPAEALIGRRHDSLGDAARTESKQLDELLLARRNAVQFEMAYRHADGSRSLWVLVNVALLQDNDRLPCFLYQALDMSERHATEIRLEQIARRDHLTGLYNRHFLDTELVRAINYSRRYDEALCVAFVDLDNFKQVNDSLGHEAGDEILCTVARRLQASLRDSDCLTRHGGDEFVLVLHRLDTPQKISAVVEKLLRAMAEPITVEGHELRVQASIGISRFPVDGDEPRTLLRHADQALLVAKASGRSRLQFFEPGMDVRRDAQPD